MQTPKKIEEFLARAGKSISSFVVEETKGKGKKVEIPSISQFRTFILNGSIK